MCLEPYVTREPVPKGSAEYEAGQQFYRQKNFVKAVSAFQQAIRINPKEASYYYNLGLSLMWLDRNTEAIVAYKKAIALKRDYTSACSFLGSVYERMNQTEDAINAYREAVRIDPKNFFATSNLARMI